MERRVIRTAQRGQVAPSPAATAARTRAHLEQAGTPIGPIDTLIAGIALAHDLTLVTRNTREFERVLGLKLENWYD